jgi:hypothetical protein
MDRLCSRIPLYAQEIQVMGTLSLLEDRMRGHPRRERGSNLEM